MGGKARGARGAEGSGALSQNWGGGELGKGGHGMVESLTLGIAQSRSHQG